MAIPVIMPKFEMSQETGLLIEWLKNEGDQIEKGEILFVVETDKLTMEVESPGEGILEGISAKAGDEIPVTSTIAYLLAEGEAIPETEIPDTELEADKTENEPTAVEPVRASITPSAGEKIRATPAARRAAREHQADLISQGSGPRGRVQEQDMLTYVRSSTTQKEKLREQTIPLEGMRKIIANRMIQSYQNVPHIYLTVSVDMTNIFSIRKTLNEKFSKIDAPRISVTALLVFLVSRVMENHAWLNGSLDAEEIILYEQINIGIAVALENGLIVPVIKNANTKTIAETAGEVNELARKAHENKLMPDDITGGTFTITNLGPFGVEQFTAIINPGQTGILAVGATRDEVVPLNGEVVIRPIMRITLAADHRVVDGATAADFLKEIKMVFENPAFLLFSD
jgi:pyruvate dehydrogenase E2 component (dihydrolipoamide acetyltransferase)